MSPEYKENLILLGLPKGRMQEEVFKLLGDAGIKIDVSKRAYRPTLSIPSFEAKILKPQTIIEMLATGYRDLGFAGTDWVVELEADLIELLDTDLNPVKLVAAAPKILLTNGKLPITPLVIASEYENISRNWIKANGLNAQFIKSYGATEVFPPEDADCIIDNTATGETLKANNLAIISEIMVSSTKLYASKQAWENPRKRENIETLVMLLQSALNARSRAMLEINVTPECLEAVANILPAMRASTISKLCGDIGYVIKAAVPKKDIAKLIPEIKKFGGTDIIVSIPTQIVT